MVRSCGEKRGRKLHERIMTAEVNGSRSRGQLKKRWGDIIQQDMKSLRLKKEHTVYVRFIRKKTLVDKSLLEYMSKKLNTR